MGAHPEKGRLALQHSRKVEKTIPVLFASPPGFKVVGQPAWTLDPDNGLDTKAGRRDFVSQFIRMMEEGIREVFRLVCGIPVLTVLQIPFDNPYKVRVFQEFFVKSVKGGGKAGDTNGKEHATRLQHTTCFP